MSETIIPEKLFFKIGEVCELAGVQAHVLRYWESEFPMLAPQKNRAGQRTYRRRDVEMALRIKELLYDEQYTIAGAKKKLANDSRAPAREISASATVKPALRRLQPPPSLAGRVPPPAIITEPVMPITDDQRGVLRELGRGLQEILDLLDEGDAQIRSPKAKAKEK